jgi:hypothetical protein
MTSALFMAWPLLIGFCLARSMARGRGILLQVSSEPVWE